MNFDISSSNSIMASRKLPDFLKHFDILDNLDGNFKATCKYCLKEISGCLKATSKFIKHMKRNHLIKYEELNSFKEPTDDKQLKLNILTTSNKKYPHHDVHQLEITDELVNFIAGDLLPLLVVESSRF